MKKILIILILILLMIIFINKPIIEKKSNLNSEINNNIFINPDIRLQINTLNKNSQIIFNPIFKKNNSSKNQFYIIPIIIGGAFLWTSYYCFTHPDNIKYPTINLIGIGFGWCGFNLIIKSIRF